MSRSARNHDVPTISQAEAEANIIAWCKKVKAYGTHYHLPHGVEKVEGGVHVYLAAKSSLGEAAFPARNFKAQGAAFAVAKIAHDMEKRGVLVYHSEEYGEDRKGNPRYSRGYYINSEKA